MYEYIGGNEPKGQVTTSSRQVAAKFYAQPWFWMVVAGVVLVTLPFYLPRFYMYLVTEMCIMALAAMGLNLILGYSGQVTFGHACFLATGAYTVAILADRYGVPAPIGLIAAPLVSAVVALIIGYFCVKLTLIYHAMLTLAFGMLVWAICWKWYDFTRGEDGLTFSVPEALIPLQNTYWLVLGVSALSIFVLWRIVNSPFGWTLRAHRENRPRCEAVGLNVRRYQLINFVLSGVFIGIAGGLFAIFLRGAYAEFSHWMKSGDLLIMCLLGGMGTFAGPAVGGVLLVYLDYLAPAVTQYWALMKGVILLLFVLFLPGGILGFIMDRIRGRRERRLRIEEVPG